MSESLLPLDCRGHLGEEITIRARVAHYTDDGKEIGLVFDGGETALLTSWHPEQPKDAPDVEAVANAEAPNRYQEYGLDVHKAFVGGAIFGSQYRAKQAKGDLTL